MSEADAWVGVFIVLSFLWVALLSGLWHYVYRTDREEKNVDSTSGQLAFITNDIKCLNNISLLKAFRIFCSLFLTALIIVILVDMEDRAFSRYTVWGLFLSYVYFVYASFQKNDTRIPEFLLTALTIESLVSIGYWSMFADDFEDKSEIQQFHIVGAHAIVQGFLVLDMLMTWIPIPYDKGTSIKKISLMVTGFYLIYGTIMFIHSHETEIAMPYPVLDPKETKTAAPIYLGGAVLQLIMAALLDSLYEWKPMIRYVRQGVSAPISSSADTRIGGATLHF